MESKLPAILVACLLFCISSRGAEARMCELEDIKVTQAGTGEWAHGMPVYAVTVKNTCRCPQHEVVLSCDGFKSTLGPDPAKFRPYGVPTLCLLNNGEPLVPGHDVTFKYAWSSQFKLPPVQMTSPAPAACA